MTKRQEYMKLYNKKYGRSKIGLVAKIYHHMVRNTKTRKHDLPNFSQQELFTWCSENIVFNKIYEMWILSNFDQELIPSLDRKNNEKSYTFDNIQITTWKKNKENAYEAIRKNKLKNTSLLNGGHKKVLQYSLSGIFIDEYISVSEAARQNKIKHQGISNSCTNKRVQSNGFIWCFKEDNDSFLSSIHKRIKEINKNNKCINYEVEQYDIDNNILIQTFPSLKYACEYENISFKTMTKWLNGEKTPRKKQYYNYKRKFKYETNE